MFQKLLSYLIPINVLKQESIVNKSLEVTWNNGELVLDTLNTNYSYGSLQRILRIGLLKIGFDKIKKYNKILILGVAAGSVIKTLVNEIGFRNEITAVEIDPKTIEIANKYFGLDKIENVEIIIDDAKNFVQNNSEKYDLIIIDIFQDNFMPKFLFDSSFVNAIISLMANDGNTLFNTMVLNTNDEKRNADYISIFDANKFKVEKISKLEKYNELMIVTSMN